MHLHRAMAIFILNKTSRLEPKSQKRVESALKALPAGSFHTEPANVTHFVVTKEAGAIVQITGTGPSGTTFVDPAHDPRKR